MCVILTCNPTHTHVHVHTHTHTYTHQTCFSTGTPLVMIHRTQQLMFRQSIGLEGAPQFLIHRVRRECLLNTPAHVSVSIRQCATGSDPPAYTTKETHTHVHMYMYYTCLAKYQSVDICIQGYTTKETHTHVHMYMYYQEHMSRRRRQGASNYVERHLHLRAFSAFHIRTVVDYGEYPLW